MSQNEPFLLLSLLSQVFCHNNRKLANTRFKDIKAKAQVQHFPEDRVKTLRKALTRA
jgi:hypothetical protein